MRLASLVTALLLALGVSAPAAAGPVEDCAAEARFPTHDDPSGKFSDAIDVPRAIAACRAALALKPGDPALLANLGRALDAAGEYNEALASFFAAAEAGSPQAMRNLAVRYELGHKIPKDKQAALRWMLAAAQKNYVPAQEDLAKYYRDGVGTAASPPQALAWALRAAQSGGVDGMTTAADLLLGEEGNEKDPGRARLWFERASALGNAYAMRRIGELYDEGIGLELNDEEAVSWYRRSAEAGDAEAMIALGNMYERGEGVEKDRGEAIGWYRRAFDAGHVRDAPPGADARFVADAGTHRKERHWLSKLRSAPAPRGSRITSSADVSQWIRVGEALLFYAFDSGRLRVYFVDELGVQDVHEVDATAALVAEASSALRRALRVDQIASQRAPVLRGAVRARSLDDRKLKTEEAAARVGALVLPPSIIVRFKNYDKLWVVGDGVFGTIPFSMLPVGPVGEDRMLVDEVSIAMAASLWDLEFGHEDWSVTGNALRIAAGHTPNNETYYADQSLEGRLPILAVGNPHLPKTRWSAPPLSGAEAEAEHLKQVFGATTLIGANATKNAVQRAMVDHQVIHLAAHGIADAANPVDGGLLMLAGPDEAGAFLTAREVQGMQLKAQLAVLSACQSGLGQAHAGGMIGLSRAFTIAGVPRVAMSLWSVHDDATLFLMKRFYHHLMHGGTGIPQVTTRSPAEALRLAMLDGRETLKDPALWASFSMFGSLR